MDKLIEDRELLKIGKKTFDVSNVSIGRKKIARRVWDNMVSDYTKEISEAKEEDKRLNKNNLRVFLGREVTPLMIYVHVNGKFAAQYSYFDENFAKRSNIELDF